MNLPLGEQYVVLLLIKLYYASTLGLAVSTVGKYLQKELLALLGIALHRRQHLRLHLRLHLRAV
jgi:hypothetical protein